MISKVNLNFATTGRVSSAKKVETAAAPVSFGKKPRLNKADAETLAAYSGVFSEYSAKKSAAIKKNYKALKDNLQKNEYFKLIQVQTPFAAQFLTAVVNTKYDNDEQFWENVTTDMLKIPPEDFGFGEGDKYTVKLAVANASGRNKDYADLNNVPKPLPDKIMSLQDCATFLGLDKLIEHKKKYNL